MKHLKNIFLALFATAFVSFAFGQTTKQDRDAAKKTAIENGIQSKQFEFIPQAVTPLGGSTRQLGTSFDITVANDSLISYLPYFGRAYSAIGAFSNRGPLDFTSTNFDYNVTERSKGGWVVTIKPKDNRNVDQYIFNVSEKGFASLDMISNNRQSISFTGYINATKQ